MKRSFSVIKLILSLKYLHGLNRWRLLSTSRLTGILVCLNVCKFLFQYFTYLTYCADNFVLDEFILTVIHFLVVHYNFVFFFVMEDSLKF